MRYLRLHADFTPSESIRFPENPVNTFRGALGYHFKRIVCFQKTRRDTGCHGCLAETSCLYAKCFETGRAEGKLAPVVGSGIDTPHPFVFDSHFQANASFEPGAKFSFGLTLFGPATDSLPHLVCALCEAGERGFSSGRVPCRLESVRSVSGNEQTLFNSSENVLQKAETKCLSLETPLWNAGKNMRARVNFLTPTSFKSNEKGNVTNLPEFHRMIRSITRRYSAFLVTDGKRAPDWNYREIFERAEKVKIVENDLKMVCWERFSSHQKQRAFWGGSVGSVVYEGHIQSFLPLLRAGEILHVGRGTTFGQGRYELVESR